MYQKSPAVTIVEPPLKPVAVDFNGGKLTSDGGAPLLQLADQKIQLTSRIDKLIHDPRDPDYITHQQRDLIKQRIYAIALGYEGVNDHITMRKDPGLLTAVKNTADEDMCSEVQ